MFEHFKETKDWQKAHNYCFNNLPYTKEEIDFILEELKEYKPKVLNYCSDNSLKDFDIAFNIKKTEERKATSKQYGLTQINHIHIVFFSSNLKLLEGEYSPEKLRKSVPNRHCFTCYVYTNGIIHKYRKHHKNDDQYYIRKSDTDLKKLIEEVKQFIKEL